MYSESETNNAVNSYHEKKNNLTEQPNSDSQILASPWIMGLDKGGIFE